MTPGRGGRQVPPTRRGPAADQPGALDSTAVLPSGPVRTCVGCRTRAAKTDLLRVVADGDRLVPDPAGRMPGRGASVHRDPRCVDLAERRKAFPRALRLPGPLDLRLVRESLRQDSTDSTDQHHPETGQPPREQVEPA